MVLRLGITRDTVAGEALDPRGVVPILLWRSLR